MNLVESLYVVEDTYVSDFVFSALSRASRDQQHYHFEYTSHFWVVAVDVVLSLYLLLILVSHKRK